jgi:hypothetical protein
MNSSSCPLSVTILGWIYVAVGVIGAIGHASEFLGGGVFHSDVIWIELTEFVAILCGIFILRGQNWARWVALAWMAFHVILSAFRALPEFAIHCAFCAVIAWFLFRPAAARYFRQMRQNEIRAPN